MKIGVKYCGNCNPHVPMPSVLQGLVERVPAAEFVPWDSPGCGVLLVLCGCPNGCAQPPAFSGQTVFVTSQTVDHWPVAEADLVETVGVALAGASCLR